MGEETNKQKKNLIASICFNPPSYSIVAQARNLELEKITYLKKFGSNTKAELLQLNRTQFSSLGIFISKNVGNRKN